MAKITIYLDARKLDKDKLAKVYLRLNIQSQQKYYFITKVSPKYWDKKRDRAKNHLPISRDTNNLIDKFQNEAENILLNFKLKRKMLTVSMFEKLFFSEDTNSNSFYEFVSSLNADFISKKFSKGTLHVYNTQLSKMKQFKSELNFSDIDTAFIRSYEAYLYSELRNKKSTANKTLIWFKSVLNKAIEKDIIKENPFKGIKLQRIAGERVSLSLNEVDQLVQLYNKKVLPVGQQTTLRHFLFCCYTGISFGDLEGLTAKNLKTYDNKIFIVKNRKKTDNALSIPLVEKAKELIQDEQCFGNKVFATFCDQTYNKHLKLIMKTAAIQKSISFHCSRHTFATVGFNRFNIPIEVISKVLGHKDIKTTMIYTKIDYERMHKEVIKWDAV